MLVRIQGSNRASADVAADYMVENCTTSTRANACFLHVAHHTFLISNISMVYHVSNAKTTQRHWWIITVLSIHYMQNNALTDEVGVILISSWKVFFFFFSVRELWPDKYRVCDYSNNFWFLNLAFEWTNSVWFQTKALCNISAVENCEIRAWMEGQDITVTSKKNWRALKMQLDWVYDN